MTDNSNYPDVFHFDDEYENFEDWGKSNGQQFWYARDLMELLGYESYATFTRAVNRAVAACTALGIQVMDNFGQCTRTISGKLLPDMKLSRFACYLTAMNGDPKKPQVAAAQAYFATIAESFQRYFQEADHVERVAIREDVSEREKSLNAVAKQAGVTHYPFFQNAGYRGMYNMNLSALREHKGIPSSRSPLDFMGKDELAANLFRITQTELKIKNENVRGQNRLEVTAETVGQKVRQTMKDISATCPEDMPVAEDIRDMKKELKGLNKDFAKLDSPKRKKLN
ncbi:MAG: BRO family protein [Syntrophobacteraceae bacterium]